MILFRYHVGPSSIPGAGQGLFLDEPAPAGRILVAPDAIPRTHSLPEIEAMPDAATALAASVRWFEDRFTTTPEWPDECYINHSFEPSGLWHLGFVFARRPLPAGTEITVDYRHLLGEGQRESFDDAATGRAIVGLPWAQSLAMSTSELAAILARA